jgi:septal ring factor EnvC (AmiA/AmiB activator)
MVGTIFSGWLGKVGAAVILALLIVCGLLYWSHTRVTEANASLRADLAIMQGALATTEESLAAAIRERERVEKVMAQRLAAQREIQARTETELRKTSSMLAQLREEYEDVETFLSLPVPPAFIEHWMRRARANGSPDQN